MTDPIELYHGIVRSLIDKNKTIATMESCTGGLIGVLLSDLSGASEVVRGGIFSYSNEAKIINGVPADIIEKYGVYSIETARAMAKACKDRFKTDIGVGITGSIGSTDPNNADSVPGEVYISINYDGNISDSLYILDKNISERMDHRYEIAIEVARLLNAYF